jgi:hypothetical protein
MEAIRSSETSVNNIPTRRHIPEDGILHCRRRENLKSHKSSVVASHRCRTNCVENTTSQLVHWCLLGICCGHYLATTVDYRLHAAICLSAVNIYAYRPIDWDLTFSWMWMWNVGLLCFGMWRRGVWWRFSDGSDSNLRSWGLRLYVDSKRRQNYTRLQRIAFQNMTSF